MVMYVLRGIKLFYLDIKQRNEKIVSNSNISLTLNKGIETLLPIGKLIIFFC